MNGSMIFASWRQCAPHLIHASLAILYPTQQPNGTSIHSAIFAHLTAECRRAYPSPKNCPLAWGDLDPHLTHGSLGILHWVYIPNGIAIGSAIFAQLTAECHWAMPYPLKKLHLCMGQSGLHLIHGSLGPPESKSQTASRLVKPFCTAHWERQWPPFTLKIAPFHEHMDLI